MANKAYRINVSGVGGIVFLVVLIVLGFLALSFLLVFVGVVLAALLIGFVIRKILLFLKIKKEVKTTKVEYYNPKMIEETEYKVVDDEEPDDKNA